MSGRRRPRPQRRRTLRARLVVASVTLIAVVCAVIGTVTTLTLRQHLYDQLDGQLREVSARASGNFGPPGTSGPQQQSRSIDLTEFVTRGPQPGSSTLIARVENGAVTAGTVGQKSSNYDMGSKALTETQMKAVNATAQDRHEHTVDIPGLGSYRVKYTTGVNGDFYVAIPTKDADNTVSTLVIAELSVTAAGLIAAGIAGYILVGVATRPLRKVAATATRVSELPLHTGEVNLSERVPESETDPHTEVGQVGAALNRMLDHIHGALHARQQSEMRVRQFVADASHELRTPLASIRGYAELTRRGREEVGPDTRHALGRIESEAGRMTFLVEDLLLLARLDAGRPLQFEQTDLVPLVIDTVSDARAAGRDHVWRLELPDEPAIVSADAARLQQVLVNLLANARTHTPPGTTVTARVQRRGPWLCVDVHDNGQGIPEDLLPHVFERFARGDSARSRNTGSTGLGLAIVQAVATAHGGAVTVDSVPGQTVFTVHLPALAPQPSPETNWQRDSQGQHSPGTWVQQGV
ncbi:sensor histidine kinase [Streptomyces acidiscabies]|uniref:histidine kinase n=1 Tax=Streptomyces acidiscabies TaxID=42234 RepID=A0AAP6EGM2_9ACTN|nr:HAMP domain-containing sensor histidine kinase [Streptomyces acidiscabies]MBP5938489.1 HAMP domain-containing histidine kinase [Streptomyces sp. LBUM 1476]MBZ3909594.1 HAMP domain-containing histidine kinase [Streptomyces acidiscabies]MDX2962237.1 HAMP domain-containing sensor histidine kinase [Streptomyces acidiscabies]MDX3019689.1 HAMP domain-containing sensor histidine kinase [Streptomyces acidiscabies]MDX3792256.1 HAMP domain-containing sensor histidine kinase [Streptomyces acidiscabies